MNKIDEFKNFVRTKPQLISYVRSGEMTWQKFYELWFLYGADHEVWNKYNVNKDTNKTESKQESFNLTEFFKAFKNVDLETVRQSITGIQKAIGLVQEITNKGNHQENIEIKEPYKPRPIYRRFED